MVQELKVAEEEYAKWKQHKDEPVEHGEEDYQVINYRDKFALHGTWADPDRGVKDQMQLCFYPFDSSISLFDISLNRLILRRTRSEFTTSDLFIGARVTIHGRPVIIDGYADEYTKKKMAKLISVTLALIKPSGMQQMGPILNYISLKGFTIVYCKMVHMTQEQAAAFYEVHHGTPFLPFLINHITSAPVLVLVLSNADAIPALREVMGNMDPAKAMEEDPCSIRARFGINKVENAIHGATNEKFRNKEIKFFFPNKEDLTVGIPPCATFKNPLLCLLKNHIIKEGFVGRVVEDIMNCGFNVTGICMYFLNTENCNDFLAAYRGVLSNYGGLIDELVSGPVIALEITTTEDDPDFHAKFKLLVGPENPTVARLINPTSIRARYGHTVLKNALYMTVLPIDGLLECFYFFNTT